MANPEDIQLPDADKVLPRRQQHEIQTYVANNYDPSNADDATSLQNFYNQPPSAQLAQVRADSASQTSQTTPPQQGQDQQQPPQGYSQQGQDQQPSDGGQDQQQQPDDSQDQSQDQGPPPPPPGYAVPNPGALLGLGLGLLGGALRGGGQRPPEQQYRQPPQQDRQPPQQDGGDGHEKKDKKPRPHADASATRTYADASGLMHGVEGSGAEHTGSVVASAVGGSGVKREVGQG